MIFIDAPARLESQVEGLWSLRGQPQGLYSGLPKPFVEMIISLSGHHFWQRDEDGVPFDYKLGWITPLQSGPRYAQTHGPLHLIGVRLSISTATKLFGPDINQGQGTPIPLDCVLGKRARDLRDQLLELGTESDRLRRLGQWLAVELEDCSEIALPTTEELVEFGWRTDMLAEHMGLSTRGLRSRFNTKFGIGPKFWLQLNRFDHVLGSQMLSVGLAATAANFGYADQAHMTSEFKRFAGRPPGDYLKLRTDQDAPANAPHYVPNSN